MSYEILLPLALILAFSKVRVKVCQRLGRPHVVGMLLAGVLIGLLRLIPGQSLLTGAALDGLSFLSKVGVILLMFSACGGFFRYMAQRRVDRERDERRAAEKAARTDGKEAVK